MINPPNMKRLLDPFTSFIMTNRNRDNYDPIEFTSIDKRNEPPAYYVDKILNQEMEDKANLGGIQN